MGMSEFYGTSEEAESIATIHRAIELGVKLLDTADMYGAGANERLVGSAISDRRDQVVLATKFGVVRDPDTHGRGGISGRPEYVITACDASLQRLGIDHIDLYYQHRVDPDVPIEETVGDGVAHRCGQGPLPRSIRGVAGDDQTGTGRPSDRGAPERVLAVDA
jgi:aryl-alcohol dehydrogenase-like predicted oxidoreductase